MIALPRDPHCVSCVMSAIRQHQHLNLGHLGVNFIQRDLQSVHLSEEEKQYVAVGTVRSSWREQVLTIIRLTHSLYTTKLFRIKCYTMLSTISWCKDVQHAISVSKCESK